MACTAWCRVGTRSAGAGGVGDSTRDTVVDAVGDLLTSKLAFSAAANLLSAMYKWFR
jgi:hypothetical protein